MTERFSTLRIVRATARVAPTRFSNQHQSELNKIPTKIEELEKKLHELSEELSNTEDRNPANLAHISIEIEKVQNKIDELEKRWIELEELKKLN